ncbi:MAG: hypothetical protein BMS9Abin17_1610 [Acidimicrobiia bacterium]|nr:MAG: hypothetical protein BMS9Abin17_1610 [Acidimicrobiia bacterium]
MPHSGKRFTPGPVGGRSSSSRGVAWSKYGDVAVDAHEGIPSEIIVAVDGIAVVQSEDDSTKYEDRPSSAPLPPLVETSRVVSVKRKSEWVTTRSIDGRTYRRRDELIIEIV